MTVVYHQTIQNVQLNKIHANCTDSRKTHNFVFTPLIYLEISGLGWNH